MNEFFLSLIKVVVFFGVLMTAVAYLVWLERRVCAFIQDRLGPNRVGVFGLLQPLADVIKLMFKEAILPKRVDRTIYYIAPLLIFIPTMLAFAGLPYRFWFDIGWGKFSLNLTNIDIGVIFVLAIAPLSVYGIILGGWASNNKYSLLGALRSAAQILSYEIPLVLSIIGVVLVCNSVDLRQIEYLQTRRIFGFIPMWNVLLQPVAFIIFIISVFAECNRLPFDLPEAEQELVGGYHTEYSSMKFAMFFMAEYAAMILLSCFTVILFLGGADVPGLSRLNLSSNFENLLRLIGFCIKVAFVLFAFIWTRWTLPRFRYDQLMKLGWKFLIPIAIINLLVSAFLVVF